MKRSLKTRFAFWLHGRALQMSPMVSMAWTQFIENRAQERAQQILAQAERARADG